MGGQIILIEVWQVGMQTIFHLILTLIQAIHKEKSNKMQQCIKILLFPIDIKLNLFRATHRPSSGA